MLTTCASCWSNLKTLGEKGLSSDSDTRNRFRRTNYRQTLSRRISILKITRNKTSRFLHLVQVRYPGRAKIHLAHPKPPPYSISKSVHTTRTNLLEQLAVDSRLRGNSCLGERTRFEMTRWHSEDSRRQRNPDQSSGAPGEEASLRRVPQPEIPATAPVQRAQAEQPVFGASGLASQMSIKEGPFSPLLSSEVSLVPPLPPRARSLLLPTPTGSRRSHYSGRVVFSSLVAE